MNAIRGNIGTCSRCSRTEHMDGSKVGWVCVGCNKFICRECTMTIPRSEPVEYYHDTLCSEKCWNKMGRPQEEEHYKGCFKELRPEVAARLLVRWMPHYAGYMIGNGFRISLGGGPVWVSNNHPSILIRDRDAKKIYEGGGRIEFRHGGEGKIWNFPNSRWVAGYSTKDALEIVCPQVK